jgi:tetratricopeptide (TPR) repeat protein
LTDAPRDRVCALRVTVAALVLAFGRPIIAQTEPFEAIAAQAAAARETGELERAVDMYRRALSLKPNWPEGLWYLGTTFFELQRYAESRAHLGRLLTMQPEHAGALGLSGLCSFHLQQYEDALRDLVRARALGISQTPALAVPVRYHLAILLTRFSDFEVGYAVLSEFAVENNESAQVIAAFGLNLLRKPLLPSEVPAEDQPLVQLAGRAAFAMAARRSAEARRILDELAATFPRTPNVHYARGVFRLTDAPEQAVEDLKRELAITPSHLLARIQLVFELLKQGKVEEARPFAEDAVRLDTLHVASYLARGQVRFESNDLDGAITDFQTATRLAPESAQAHFVLSRAYARAGRIEDAERERAEFMRLEQLTKGKPTDVRSVIGAPASGESPQ